MEKHNPVISFIFNRLILQHPIVVIGCILAATIFFGFGARYFKLDASAETLVLENDKDLRYARLIDSRFGSSDFLVLTFKPNEDLFSDKTLGTLARLRDDLKKMSRVESVRTILDVPLLESPLIPLKEIGSITRTLESPDVDKTLARKELKESPLYNDLLVSSDLKTTSILITFPHDTRYEDFLQRRNALHEKKAAGTLTTAEQVQLKDVVSQFSRYRDEIRQDRHNDIAAIRSIMNRYRQDGSLFLGGVSMIADDMITFVKNDLKVFGVGVLMFLVLTLGIIFRRLRWICFPLLCCAISVVYMVGLLGWLDWKVTVVSANFISLQLITTVAIVIYLTVQYRELLVQNPQTPNRQLIFDTLQQMLKPCWYTAITTIAGFGSLVLCDILPVIMFGWMMMVSLLVSLVVSFTLFPAILVLLPRETPPNKKKSRFDLTHIFAHFTEAHGMLIIGISSLVLVGSIIGITKLKIENSFINYFYKSTEIYKGMMVIDRNLGGTTPLDIIVDFENSNTPQPDPRAAASESEEVFDKFDELDKTKDGEKYWFTSEKINRIKTIQNYLENLPETGKVMSAVTLVQMIERVNGGKALDNVELALLFHKMPDQLKQMLVTPYVSVEHNEARLTMRIRDSEPSLKRNDLLKKIRSDMTDKLGLKPEQVHLAGMLVLYNNMLQSLFGSQIVTLGLTALMLTGMFLVLFRSLKIALIAMLPNVFPVSVMLGVMGWLNIPLDMMTITIASISMGIAVDTTIHYVHRFKYEFQKDRRYLPVMHRCHESIGNAMYYTSVTIIMGFSILSLSNFIPSVCFGLLTGLVIFISILAALTLLPKLLILWKPFGKES